MKIFELSDLLGGHHPNQPAVDEPQILLEARIMRLREEFDRYGKVTFKPGDIVTALPTSLIKWAGVPMIVLETKDPIPLFGGDDEGNAGNGWKPSVRCAHLVGGGHIVRHWYEAEDLEIYPYMEETNG